ncbi:MAG: DUF1559 domain-containing protein [Planctomycetia bacterium]|nr:DUF1559 domain-containing protein [Planctomycetia bacterium]
MLREKYAARKGFTLVELLVVIAIIGIMMGLLMPAVMNARSSARMASCINRQENLAKAVIQYELNKQHYPYSMRNGYSWHAQILDELGLAKLANTVAEGNIPSTNQPEFKCPSGDATTQGISYVANVGCDTITTSSVNGDINNTKLCASGLFFYYCGKGKSVKKTASSIVDGTSQTILLSENTKKTGITDAYKPSDYWWTTTNYSNEAESRRHVGITWSTGISNSATTPSQYLPYFPRSQHSKVNVMAFADGSVKGVNNNIYYQTYVGLMAPNDNKCGYTFNTNMGVDPNYQ